MKRFLAIGIALAGLSWFAAGRAAAQDVGGIVDRAIRGDVGGAVARGLGATPGRWDRLYDGRYGGDWGRYRGSHGPYYNPRYYSRWYGYNYYHPYYSSYYYPYYGYRYPYYGGSAYGYGYPGYGAGYGYPADGGAYGTYGTDGAYGAYGSAYWPEGAQAGPGEVAAAGPVRILNPAANEANLSFTVNGQRYTLPPGYRLDLPTGAGQVIEFHRGGQLGTVRYTLQSGVYTFTPTEQGWELYHTSPTFPAEEGQFQGPQRQYEQPPRTEPGPQGTYPQPGTFAPQQQGAFGQPQTFEQGGFQGQFQGQQGGFQGQQGGFQGQQPFLENPPVPQ